MRDKLMSAECAVYLKALADPERLKIVQCLQSGPKNVTQIAELMQGELANISHHLGVLRHAGLVKDKKQGKFVIYELHSDFFRPASNGSQLDCLDFQCCRLELGKG